MTAIQDIGTKFWLLAGLTFLLNALMTFMNLYEFVTIGLLKNTTDYPFGGEGPVPWYYKTDDLYAKVNLVFGLAFLLLLIAAFYTILRKKKMGLLTVFLSSIFLILIMIVNGQAN